MITSCLIGSVVAWIMFVVGNPTLYAHPWFATLKMIQIRMLVIQSQQNLLGDAVHSLSQKFFLVTFHSLLARSELINLFGFYVRVHLDFILFLVGGGTLLGREIKEFTRNSRISTRSIIVLWTVITFAGTIAWLPLNWLRYYLPVMPCVALLIGYGLSEILMAAWFLWKHIQQDKIT